MFPTIETFTSRHPRLMAGVGIAVFISVANILLYSSIIIPSAIHPDSSSTFGSSDFSKQDELQIPKKVIEIEGEIIEYGDGFIVVQNGEEKKVISLILADNEELIIKKSEANE